MKKAEFTAKTKTDQKGPDGKPIYKEFKGTYDAYETLKEAQAALGDDKVLAAVNQIKKAAAMTALREQRQPGLVSTIKKLSPEGRKEIDKILSKYGYAPGPSATATK